MVVMLLVTSAVTFWLYIYSYLRSYKHELDMLSSYAVSNLDGEYFDRLLAETKEIYDSIPEDLGKDPFSAEFKNYFKPLVDERYHDARQELIRCRENTDISNIYLGFYDSEHDRLVIVLDGDIEEYYYIPGQYISNENGYLEDWKTIEKIMRSKWFMSFAHTSLIGFSATDYFPIYGDDKALVGLVAVDTNLEYFADEA